MLQTINDREVYVVEFDTLPTLPITWSNEFEKPYALALAAALREGLVNEPGKYGVEVTYERDQWIYNIYHIDE